MAESRPIFLRFLTWLLRLLMSILTVRQVEGLENIPDPPYIMAINHLGTLDVPLVYTLPSVVNMIGWAAEKYERHPFFGPILRSGETIFIQRGQVDREALNKAVKALKAGKAFGMSPEGTRSRTRALIRGRTGVAYLAAEADVPVVPAAVTGTESAVESFLRLRRPRLKLRIGKPFKLPPLPEENRAAALRHNTDEVMCRIAAMLPPHYRGVYAEHPRTLELLEAEVST